MSIGMTAQEFWHGPLELAGAYREAWRIKMDNAYVAEWRQGVYVERAVGCVMDHLLNRNARSEYPQEPLWSSEKAAAELAEERERAQTLRARDAFKALAADYNARFAERRRREGEQSVGSDD